MITEVPKINQMLVAVGDRQPKRLEGTVDAPHGKSFIPYRGDPLLAYTLDTHCREGFEEFVFLSNTKEQLGRIEEVITRMSDRYPVRDVEYVQDDGDGTTGLPLHAKRKLGAKLHPRFGFDFGHNAARDLICDLLIPRKTDEVVVFRGYYPKERSDHPTVYVDEEGVAYADTEDLRSAAPPYSLDYRLTEVAAPYILDHTWVDELEVHGFNFRERIQSRIERGGLIVVTRDNHVDVPEIDTPEDYDSLLGESSDPFTRFVMENEAFLSTQIDPEALRQHAPIPARASKFQIIRYLDNFRTVLMSLKAIELMEEDRSKS